MGSKIESATQAFSEEINQFTKAAETLWNDSDFWEQLLENPESDYIPPFI